ncbi:MAG: RnfABCDGE type electron transport complex subunit B [Arenicellaceae bacterium]|nr:RnfABCDGE type electron transport complex subunit B [Arenicellaceae bacterium]
MTHSWQEIDKWLPQTQCTRCGYPNCKEYAQAVSSGTVDINRCPPGGDVTIRGLASLLGKIGKPLAKDLANYAGKQLAQIDEDICIGCVICIQACPVDAISGAAKQIHTVISDECTGCELCILPCPVDCISLVPVESAQLTTPFASDNRWPDHTSKQVQRAREQTYARHDRLQLLIKEKSAAKRLKDIRKNAKPGQLKSEITAAVARVKAKQNPSK